MIGCCTLDRLLKQAGVRQSVETGPPVQRRSRPRCPAEGVLLQIDGSPFA